MKRLLIAGLALALLVPACAFAQNAYSGTWKMVTSTMHQSGHPLVLSLKDGMYHCNCTPPIAVKADGADHAVTGHSGYDTVAIKVLNDHSIQQTNKKDGKVVSERTTTVAADGKTATEDSSFNGPSGPSNNKAVLDRIAKGAHGSNAITGSWQLAHVISTSGSARTDTYKVDDDDISYSDTMGDSYSAKIDGKPSPLMKDGKQAGTVSVKRLGKHTLRETYSNDGKVRLTSTMTISADGKTMKSSNHNLQSGTTTSWVSDKQ